MAGKLKEQAKESRSSVMDGARQIWLAGLGAFARTTEEGGKLFNSLVEEGEKVQGRSREGAGGAAARPASNLDRIEQIFEDRVARVLSRLGVPSNDDVQELSRHVHELTKAVRQLSEEQPAAKAKPAKAKPAAAKPAAKPAAQRTSRKTTGSGTTRH